jgi:5,10-methylene-tetrahydrofolate dehydrogenase/methenyl tetrahydrofolate cyclohydrolase
MELVAAGCTVTITHESTPRSRLEEDIGRADILVVATGVPNLIPGVRSAAVQRRCFRRSTVRLPWKIIMAN